MTGDKENAPAATGANESAAESKLVKKRSKPRTKRHKILGVLATGKSLNRFEAENLGDHCLNTTISEIERFDGITVSRRFERLLSRDGHPFKCCRYWLELDQREKAGKVLS